MFLHVVTQSLLFAGVDCPRSKMFEVESYLGLSQSFLCIFVKRSGTDGVAQLFFEYIFFICQAELGVGHAKQ